MASGYTEIFAWGGDHFGQLGLAGKETGQTYSVPRFCSFNVIISSISCGEEHTGFLTNNGLIYTIGNNADGRLGVGDRSIKFSSSPCLVEVETKIPAASIACGWGHTAVAFEDGSIFTWGLGDFGVLGTGDTTCQWAPVKVPLSATTKAGKVSCGSRHTALVTYLGELWMCGSGDAGQLGTGRRDVEYTFTKISTEEEVSHISCGIFHTGVVTRSGKIFTMGGNTFGQLGINSKKSTSIPTQVADLAHVCITKVACGHHTAALSDRGELYIWGSGVFGEFLAPQKVISLKTPIKDISIGGCFGSAIDINGMVWTWGSNASGELGVGDYEPRVNPFPIVALQGKKVTQIACGGTYAMALGLDVSRDIGRAGSGRRSQMQSQSKTFDETTQHRSFSPIDSTYTRPAESRSPLRQAHPQRTSSVTRTYADRTPPRAPTPTRPSPLKLAEERPRHGLMQSPNLRTPAHDAEKSTIQNHLVDLKKEIQRLQEGSGGIQELTRMLSEMQAKNDELRREATREHDRSSGMENELSLVKSRAEAQLADLNECYSNQNSRYERKIAELENVIAQHNSESKAVQDMNSRLSVSKIDAENEVGRLQQLATSLESRLNQQQKADRDAREFLESRLAEQERMARESREQFENRLSNADQQHHETRQSFENRLSDADRVLRETQDAYEMQLNDMQRQHQDQISMLESASRASEAAASNAEIRQQEAMRATEEEATRRRKLEYDLDLAEQQRIQLEKQLKNTQFQVETGQQDIMQKANDIEMYNETVNRLQNEIGNMKREFERRNDELESERSALVNQLSDLTAINDRVTRDLQDVQRDLDLSKGQHSNAQRENDALSATVADNRRQIDIMQTTNSDLSLKNENLTLTLANSRNEVDLLVRQIQDLKLRNENLQGSLDDAQIKANRLSAENTDSRSENQTLARNLEQVTSEAAELRHTNASQKADYDLQTRSLDEMKAANEELNRQYSQLAGENSALQRNLDQCKSEVEDLRRINAESKHDNDILTRSLEEQQSSNEKLNRQNTELARENNDFKLQNDTMQRSSTDVQTTNTTLTRQNDGLIAENERLKRQNMDLQKENSDVIHKNDIVTRDNRDLETTNAAITSRNDDLASENDALKRQLADCRAELNQVQALYTAATDENRSLDQRLNESTYNNESLHRKLNETLADKDDLTYKVQKLDQGLAETQQYNTMLQGNIEEVEDKNKKLFATMERTLADRAREYRDKTNDILVGAASPSRSPMRSALQRSQDLSTPQVSRSPLIDRYQAANLRDRPISQSRVSKLLDESMSPQRSHSPMMNLRPSLDDTPSTPYAEPRVSDAPSQSREALTSEHQKRIAKSANKLMGRIDDSPIQDYQLSSSFDRSGSDNASGFKHQSSQQLKTNLAGIKSKLYSLQENKAALEDKMAQFEAKLKKPENY